MRPQNHEHIIVISRKRGTSTRMEHGEFGRKKQLLCLRGHAEMQQGVLGFWCLRRMASAVEQYVSVTLFQNAEVLGTDEA